MNKEQVKTIQLSDYKNIDEMINQTIFNQGFYIYIVETSEQETYLLPKKLNISQDGLTIKIMINQWTLS